jgi:hypothetical protein
MSDIAELIELIKVRSEKLGLYLRDVMVASSTEIDEELREKMDSSLKDVLASGEVQMAVFATFSLNEVAFSDRIQNPDAFDMNKQFDEIVPSDYEIALEKIRERLAKGLDILDDAEEEE